MVQMHNHLIHGSSESDEHNSVNELSNIGPREIVHCSLQIILNLG